jgi:tetrahydromethanopterin S-methyltransferase subunit E
MDLIFLAVSGFLLGSVFYIGWYTIKDEPEAKPGYALIGLGVAIDVFVNTWIAFIRDTSTWFRVGEIVGYIFVAAGLVLITRERRRR